MHERAPRGGEGRASRAGVAIRPAPTIPTLRTLRGSASRDAGLPLRAPLDEVERVERGLRLRLRHEVGDRLLLLRGSPPRPSTCAAPSIRSSARYGAGAAPCTASSSWERARRIDSSQLRRGRARRARAACSTSSSANAIDSSTNSTGSSSRSARPSSTASRPLEQPVLAQRVLTTKRTAVFGPTSRGTSCVPPQAGMIPRKTSGQREVAHGARDRARVAVQRDLDAAAEARAVDRRDRRERERADAAEEVVPRAAALDRRPRARRSSGTRRCRRRRRRRTACR